VWSEENRERERESERVIIINTDFERRRDCRFDSGKTESAHKRRRKGTKKENKMT